MFVLMASIIMDQRRIVCSSLDPHESSGLFLRQKEGQGDDKKKEQDEESGWGKT